MQRKRLYDDLNLGRLVFLGIMVKRLLPAFRSCVNSQPLTRRLRSVPIGGGRYWAGRPLFGPRLYLWPAHF